MITIATRVRYKDLYVRMVKSLKDTASGKNDFQYLQFPDTEKQPCMAHSYNQMLKQADGDCIVFVHDDIQFLSKGWDLKVIEALNNYDVAGVVGALNYTGGYIFDSGTVNARGILVAIHEGTKIVKVFSPEDKIEKVDVIDGLFMASRKGFKFDETFDGLFFYDIDYCLGKKCCVVPILLEHSKPKEYYGDYPKDMKSIDDYWDIFHSKHGFSLEPNTGPQGCAYATWQDYKRVPRKTVYNLFIEKQAIPCVNQ